MSRLPLVISHAACKGHAPENTLAGIRAALTLGVDAIEIDVHCSADRVPILMHDATIDRTTDGTGAIASLSLAELRQRDAGLHGFARAFAGERIPTLAETLDLTRGRCLLVVEIKADGIEREVVDVIGDATNDVMVWSFKPDVVERVRALAPAVPCCLLSPALDEPPRRLLDSALRLGQQGVSVYHTSVTADLVRAATLRGLTVFTWTADEPADHHRLQEAGAAGIVTNVPDVLQRSLGRRAASPA